MDSLEHNILSWPVIESILENLSATDASAFLYATRLISQLSLRIRHRYLNIYRDIPNSQVEWIRSMISHGHTVLLVGDGLHDILLKYRDPARYWNQRTTRTQVTLWLLPLSPAVAKSFSAELPFITKARSVSWIEPQLAGQQQYIEMHQSDCNGLLCGDSIALPSILVPGPNLWPKCYIDWYTPQRWNVTRVDNTEDTINDNIKFICGTDASRDGLKMGLNLHPEWNSMLQEVLPASMVDVSMEYLLQHPEAAAIPYMNMDSRQVFQTVLRDSSASEVQTDGDSIAFPYSGKEEKSSSTLTISFHIA